MKAQDTVMTYEELWAESGEKLGSYESYLKTATKQAEITWDIAFKAGKRKVIEWVNQNWLDESNMKQWKAFLKSEG